MVRRSTRPKLLDVHSAPNSPSLRGLYAVGSSNPADVAGSFESSSAIDHSDCDPHASQHQSRDCRTCSIDSTTTWSVCHGSDHSCGSQPCQTCYYNATGHHDSWTHVRAESPHGIGTCWTMPCDRCSHDVPDVVWSIPHTTWHSLPGTQWPRTSDSNASQTYFSKHQGWNQPPSNRSACLPTWAPNTWAGGSYPWATIGYINLRAIHFGRGYGASLPCHRHYLYPLATDIQIFHPNPALCGGWSSRYTWTSSTRTSQHGIWRWSFFVWPTWCRVLPSLYLPSWNDAHLLQPRHDSQEWHSCTTWNSSGWWHHSHEDTTPEGFSQSCDYAAWTSQWLCHDFALLQRGAQTWRRSQTTKVAYTLALTTANTNQHDHTFQCQRLWSTTIWLCHWSRLPGASSFLQCATSAADHRHHSIWGTGFHSRGYCAMSTTFATWQIDHLCGWIFTEQEKTLLASMDWSAWSERLLVFCSLCGAVPRPRWWLRTKPGVYRPDLSTNPIWTRSSPSCGYRSHRLWRRRNRSVVVERSLAACAEPQAPDYLCDWLPSGWWASLWDSWYELTEYPFWSSSSRLSGTRSHLTRGPSTSFTYTQSCRRALQWIGRSLCQAWRTWQSVPPTAADQHAHFWAHFACTLDDAGTGRRFA